MAFAQTHIAGAHGAPTWPAPDGTAAETQRLDPGLPVQVLETRGDWWRVQCANGWDAWTDGRWLVPLATPAPLWPTPAATVAARPADSPRVLASIGAALTVIGALLPWFEAGGYSVNAWDVEYWALITDEVNNSGIKAGLVMLLSVPAGAAAVVRLPAWAFLLCSAPAGSAAGFGLYRWFSAEVRPTLGIGLLVGLAGAALIAAAGLVELTQDQRR